MFSGQVLGFDGQVVNGVLVRVGNNVIVFDENGFYQFCGIEMNVCGIYVMVSKDGFFFGFDCFYLFVGFKNFSCIELFFKIIVGIFMGIDGGIVEVSGVFIIFFEGGVVIGVNVIYNGEVQVVVQWLNLVVSNL